MSNPVRLAGKSRLKKGELRTALLFSAPAMIPMLVFWIYPIFRSLMISLTDWDYISPTYNFVWFENYASIFDSSGFFKALTVTLLFAVYTVIPSMVIGLLLALVFQKKFAGRSVYRALLFSPWVTPTVAVSIVWVWLFNVDNGLLNRLLLAIGLPTSKWLSSRDTALMSVSLVTVWKSLGYTMIFYASALEKVPQQLYEAASIDGANAWQKFKSITLPCLSPTLFFQIIIDVINAFQTFNIVKILTLGGPLESTNTIVYSIYLDAFRNFRFGSAAARSIILFLIIMVITLIQFKAEGRSVHYS